jgi:hypothetical protein
VLARTFGTEPRPMEAQSSSNQTGMVLHVKVTFGGDAATHFGTEPIDGVVTFQREPAQRRPARESRDSASRAA